MTTRTNHFTAALFALAALLIASDPLAAAPRPLAPPDFTKGDGIPAGANHD